ncbi:MAG: ferritin-like domain-containing protein [Alcanivorax sp.]|uniref:Ferritin-like domain-containing protein n=1 Tax=Alloalcanivorax marinus TaxID=1177169 RepID=A0A9Q3UP45_9GAMM|nr:ferritin-like domain-containing protein [Alloalcanivorax marinus]MBM7333827.1 ferritin-like domain-containing protein [Alloalcanivorax marinus]MCC4309293.1 ferritin-like domain-containing protein [Alloalcanivorax marinus]MCU5788354.1 hypothetical protein [Alloalcanivorax marinus]
MTDSAPLGINRTGVQMSPEKSQDMRRIAEQTPADVAGGPRELSEARAAEALKAGRAGSVAPPGSAKGVLKAGAKKMTGQNPELLLDKLGQRLAFERTGVRLYEALIAKATALGLEQPVRQALARFRDEEAEHMDLVVQAVESLGADPTTMTPSANVAGVVGLGPLQVITDARTNFMQSLDALLSVELTDNAAWELLIELAETAGQESMATHFRHALKQEEYHLETVKGWMRDTSLEQLR